MDIKIKKDLIPYKIELFSLALFLIILFINLCLAATPQGPDSMTYNSNTTKTAPSALTVNISGGYIASFNITANMQNTRWKAFVGYVSGSFSLQDSSGSMIYNWTSSTTTGRVYASRNSTTVSWSNINCSNITTLNQENTLLSQNYANDNLNVTFNTSAGATHKQFFVGTRSMTANSCPTLNTFVNNATQDSTFEETALYDTYNIVYATVLEPRVTGYNGKTFDFQMIVPENGAPSFQSATAYYLYVELGD